MIITERKPIEQDVEVAVECDRCEKRYDKNKDLCDFEEVLRLDFTAGYTSAFGDGYRIQCDLCSDCLHQLISGYCRKSEY
ncbi:hypothetical protein [Endozoicomonas lisbonensis]|uniref:Uncharacterized protein n=1 Tax=Endozoicomonas lisbonensis TaxID=3120522 RepID=A0ABV2SD84_9GAMM